MKANEKLSSFLLTSAMVALVLICGCTESSYVQPDSNVESRAATVNQDFPDCNCIINPSAEISQEEIEILKFMREEEKLAHDVYFTLSSLYPLPIFKNIAKSELVHMEHVLCLLLHYKIDDPASEVIGVFTNPDLQDLYDELIEDGSASLIGGLTVGARIEDLDLFDLNECLNQTDNVAIITIFEFLICGSGNHLRAFSFNLDFRGVEYTPQYITPELYAEILATDHQFCGAR